ncbi:MAG: hypothetical protein K1060chlam1_00326 [Candidatus Anoxychlamydiales bacterium]|nr:hypothetical protein [Candidatus Anoxychlamydiales bacterium]
MKINVNLDQTGSLNMMNHIFEKHRGTSKEKNISKFSSSDRTEIKKIIFEALQKNVYYTLITKKSGKPGELDRVIRDVKLDRIIGTTSSSELTDSIRIISGLRNGNLISAYPIDSINSKGN